jgi:hypothetical protein
MANRIRNTASEVRNETDIKNRYPLISSSRSRSTEKNDDLILTLSDAYENQRARQVSEWERLYGYNVYRGV